MEPDYNNSDDLKSETPKHTFNTHEGLQRFKVKWKQFTQRLHMKTPKALIRLKETWVQFEAYSKTMIIGFTMIAAIALIFSFSMEKSFKPVTVRDYDILNSITYKIDSLILIKHKQNEAASSNKDEKEKIKEQQELNDSCKKLIIGLENLPLNDSLLKRDSLYDDWVNFKKIIRANQKDLNLDTIIYNFSKFNIQIKSVINKNKPNQTFQKIWFNISRILFYCFAGVAFIFIGENTNELIKNGSIKITKINYRKNLIFQKKYDKSNFYLSFAMLIWVSMDIASLIRIYSFDLFNNISYVEFNLYAGFVVSLLSTLNSYCFLQAAFGFDFNTPPWWQSRELYYDFFGDKRIIKIITICIIAFEISFLVFSFNHKRNNSGPSWTDIPDFVFSMLALVVMALHLLYAFYERKKTEFNVFVVITMILIFYAQCFVIIPKDSVLMPNFTGTLTILGLYPILLIILFLSLAESWVDYFKGIQLENEKKEIESLRRSMHHRMKNYLGRISYYAGSFLDDKSVMENELSLMIAKHIKSRVAIYQNLTDRVYNVEKLGDKVVNKTNLYEFISDLVVNFKELFAPDNFIAEIDNEGLQRFSKEDILQVDQAQYLGEYLIELVLNALKNSAGEKNAWVNIEIKNILDNALYIRVLDKNAEFGDKFEEAKGDNSRTGLRAIYKKVTSADGWQGEMHYVRNKELKTNCIEMVIPIAQLT